MIRFSAFALFAIICSSSLAQAAPDYQRDVAPLLTKYCGGCHNADDAEGGLALDSYQALLKGGKKGSAITPGRGDQSRLLRVITGQAKPAMPPEGEARPKPEEIARLKAWIDAGAQGPAGNSPDPTMLTTPKIPLITAAKKPAIFSLASSADVIAKGHYGKVVLVSRSQEKPLAELPHRGAVNDLAFSQDGRWLAAAAGEPGLFGEVRIWEVASQKQIHTLRGPHSDSLYAAAWSPDGKYLAAAGYDRKISLWDVAEGKLLKEITGHNGAIYDLAFRPNGKVLASASGDRTVKLWSIPDGERLETLKESLKELYAAAFSPDGKRLAAAGVDRRVRVWSISQDAKEGSNPLAVSHFAHEAPILQLAFSADGKLLASSAEDRLLKVWRFPEMTAAQKLPPQTDWATALTIAGNELLAGNPKGDFQRYALAAAQQNQQAAQRLPDAPLLKKYGPQPDEKDWPKQTEQEPNQSPKNATIVQAPGIGEGVLMAENDQEGGEDHDLFRFRAKAGEQWIIETKAERLKAPTDTQIEVLDQAGQPIPRMLLRAVRDSEITFRGMNSDQRGVRLRNWEEMLLNQYVYINGEVIRHYQQRRGPDSDAQFYPEGGARFSYFGASPRAHALGAPCYIVEPYPLGSQLADNGLPVFTLYYQNDDDGFRQIGKDSRLLFTAPKTADYLVRVSDVRGVGGKEFRYQLILRRPQPDFTVTLAGAQPKINAGGGKNFTVKVQRQDYFDGPVRVDIDAPPPGFAVSSPIIIQAGHREAHGVLHALPGAPPTEKDQKITLNAVASAEIFGEKHERKIAAPIEIQVGPRAKVVAHLYPTGGKKPTYDEGELTPLAPREITIAPGESITCELEVERHGFDGRISFDAKNLPHGVIVDDIGLSGILIPEGQTRRTIFLSAESWVPETSRPFHVIAKVEGNQASAAMILHVRGKNLAEVSR